MTTFKIKIDHSYDLFPILKEGNKIVRIAFNLYKKDLSLSQVVSKIKEKYNTNSNLLDTSMIKSFCQDAEIIYKSYKEKSNNTLIFGSKKQWIDFNRGKISKEEYNQFKNCKAISFLGSKCDNNGNRKMQLDIDNKQIIFKKNRKEHFYLKLNTSNSRMKMLLKIQELAKKHLIPVTYKLSQDYICITFDESILKEKEHTYKPNRIGSLDLNPNYIAFTIQDFKDDISNIIFKQIFDLTILNETFKKTKKDFEVIQIAKTISELCKHYHVESIGLEKLTIKSKNYNKGKNLNRLINNSWNRNKFLNNLKKRLNILGISNQEIIAMYSSTVGCLNYPNETDSIAAALEIGRRTYVFVNKFIHKKEEFLDKDIIFPVMDRNLIKERWNSILSGYNPTNIGYKGIHNYLKQQKKLTQLRFLFKDYNFNHWSCYRHKSIKSMVNHNFICL